METKLNIAFVLHSILCDKEHATEIVNTDPDLCEWYTEEQLTDCWEKESHKLWLKAADQFISDVSVGEIDEKKAEQTLSKILDLCKTTSFLVNTNPNVAPWIAKLMGRSI